MEVHHEKACSHRRRSFCHCSLRQRVRSFRRRHAPRSFHPHTPYIAINAPSVQAVAAVQSGILNKSSGGYSLATQNLSTNAGNVTVNAPQMQLTAMRNSAVVNSSTGGYSTAAQNLSTNVGHVDINGPSLQLTALANSFVGNFSSGSYSKAVQNLATNNGCTSCN